MYGFVRDPWRIVAFPFEFLSKRTRLGYTIHDREREKKAPMKKAKRNLLFAGDANDVMEKKSVFEAIEDFVRQINISIAPVYT